MNILTSSYIFLLCTKAFAFQAIGFVAVNNRGRGSSFDPISIKSSLPTSPPRPNTHAAAAQTTKLFVSSSAVDQEGTGGGGGGGGGDAEKQSLYEDTLLPKNGSVDKQSSVLKQLEMPWSDLHDFALRDNLPRYTRILPGKTPKKTALWRTLMQDVPELSGYPLELLREKYVISNSQNNKEEESAPEVLPFLDNFYFEPSGGISGQVYGVAGLKDGTKIETSPVGQVEVTIPLGYVLTEDDGIAYELGAPLTQEETDGYSLDGITRTAGSLSKQASATMNEAMTRQQQQQQTVGSEEDPNVMLVRLGASTGLLLASAAAMNMLSHHLTVNVFWV